MSMTNMINPSNMPTYETPNLSRRKTFNPLQFDPLKHQPPKYDIYGQLKQVHLLPGADRSNILSERENIKLPWINDLNSTSEPKTRTKLLENRKFEKVPDISYDLDRDGYVGGRDYVLAKRFDRDGDGKLNEMEKKEAYDAIAHNVEDNFVWNLDNQGSNRGYRIIQKRGKIVDAENFMPIRETYPVHPMSNKQASVNTFHELKDRRKQHTKVDIDRNNKKWSDANPLVLINENVIPGISNGDDTIMNPYRLKKQKEHRLARLDCGLKEIEDDVIKIKTKDPGLNYVYNPKHQTNKDIKAEIKRENIEESNKMAHQNRKDDIARLNDRESEIFEKLYSNNGERLTFNKLKEIRKKETLDYNLKTFSKQTLGVHGHELPKFSEHEEVKEWWRLKEGYIESPGVNSLIALKEGMKYWKKPEELLVNEHQDMIPSPDAFCKVKVLKDKQHELILKVNTLNHFKSRGFDPDNPKPIDLEDTKKNHIYKWTTLVNQFAPQKFKKGGFFDALPTENNDTEQMEMYNSLTGKGVFESAYMKGGVNDKKKDSKNMKVNEHERSLPDHQVNQTKETLYQKYASRDNVKISDRPKSFAIRTKGL